MLLGRRNECGVLDRLLEEVREGRGQCLVLRGEPGIGKSALLAYLEEQAAGCVLARAAGVQSEMELPFAGLHQLCAPMLDRLESLPGPQRDALATAFGLSEGNPPERFLVGLAVLSLLSEAAEEQPLLCLVDDAQWLDDSSAQALSFVAHRLLAESLGLVFAVREPSEEEHLRGLPELLLAGLPDADARQLLNAAIQGPLDERIRDRIVAETRGNPLALLELPHGMTAADLAGGFALPDALPLYGHIEETFRRRLQTLSADAQRLLLTAAAEPVGDPSLLWRAAEHLDIPPDATAEAEAAGLIELGPQVRFRHPLVRSAAYRSGPPHQRWKVHRALAEATDPDGDPDRRAWHRAQVAIAPDEDVASELERSAGRAQGRGGAAAAAAFLERAAEVTPDKHRRGARSLAAAEAKYQAGALDRAEQLLAAAAGGPLDDLERLRLERLRARITFARRRGNDAPPLLLAAARRLEALDAAQARETYLEALTAGLHAGFLAGGSGLRQIAEAARAAPLATNTGRPSDLLLDGLAIRLTEGYGASVPVLRSALQALIDGDSRNADDVRWVGWACRVAFDLWDDARWDEVSARALMLAREQGALDAIAVACTYRAYVQMHAGEFAGAAQLNEEAESINEAIGGPPRRYVSLVLAAWRGEEVATSKLSELSISEATASGEGAMIGLAEWSNSVLHNGLGRYDSALAEAGRAVEHADLGAYGWALIELIEAAVRCDEREVATGALEELSERTRSAGTDWALGVEACSRALLSDGKEAENQYRQAIERLGRTVIAFHLARAHLVYGEWLRRERRRSDARESLRRAHELFQSMGAGAFAARAEGELRATGERVRRRTPETLDDLTAQETRAARLAREGLSNAEIGAQLFISPRTVEYHLHKVFAKLGISSRGELGRALPTEDRDALIG